MKGKLLIVLFSLMLVSGLLIAACDNPAYPEDPYKDNHTGDSRKNAADWDSNSRERIKDGMYLGEDKTLFGATRTQLEELLEAAKEAEDDDAIEALEKALEEVKSGKDLINAMFDGSMFSGEESSGE
jgi:hypothetical protein